MLQTDFQGDCEFEEQIYPELDEEFSVEETTACIKSLSRNKSSGIDLILNEYFIELTDILPPY